MEIVGIILGIAGILFGLLNWKLFIYREINHKGLSPTPVVAVVLFLIGSFLSEFSLFTDYIWAIFFIDGAAVPMFAYFVFKTYIVGR